MDGYFLTINDGIPSWSTSTELNYLDVQFGGGVDGNLIASSGTTILTKDMYYNYVSISATASIITNGYKLYCLYLDLTSAPSGAIKWNGNVGGNGSGGIGGTGGAGLTSGSVGGSTNAGNGGNSLTAGTDAVSGSFLAGGSGSHGEGGFGGNVDAGTGDIATGNFRHPYFDHNLINGVSLLNGGGSGGGGGGNHPGGGSGGGSGAGVVPIFAKTINRGSSTSSSAIQAKGGDGGISETSDGYGGGGGGGFIYLVCNELIGSIATDCLDASGGDNGDSGGGAGRITIIILDKNFISDTLGTMNVGTGINSPGVTFKISL